MNPIFIILISLLLLIIILFIYIEPLLMKHKVKNDNEYGSARFSNFNEIKKNFNKENISNIKETGFPVYYSNNLKSIYFDRITPHYVYLGSTGSGKSATAVIPTCTFIANSISKRSVFVTDPKGEIYEHTSKMFEDNGCNVITIDFRHPELSNHINILEPIIKEYESYIENINRISDKTSKKKKLEYNNNAMSSLAETNRLIKSLSNMIKQETVEQKDPFWNNSAQQLLEVLIGFFLEEYKDGNIKREQITMTSIRKFQNSSMETANFRKFKNYISEKEYGLKSKDSLTSILSTSDNTYKSITGVFGEKMSLFDDINIANVISDSDFDFNLLGKESTVIYLIVPDEDKIYYKLITIIVGMIYKELVKYANRQENKRLDKEIDFILDEFANCPPLADIETIVSVARIRGMHFHFFIQSFSQLNNVYGKEVAQIILDNCGLIYLKTNTQETADAISKRLGKKTIESNSVRQSISLINYNGDRSTNLIGRDLMTPEEVKQLHYKTIIFPVIGFPIFRNTIMYNKFGCYKNGYIERKVIPLKDLSYTYYTVEDIKLNKKEKDIDINLEMQDNDKIKLKTLEPIIKKILKMEYIINYRVTENSRTYLEIILDRKINLNEKILLNNKINNDYFYLKLNDTAKKTIIEIYLKNVF